MCGASAMAATAMATVVARHTFGIKADVKDNIWYIDDMQVVFPVGNNIVLHNVEQKIQRFIAGETV